MISRAGLHCHVEHLARGYHDHNIMALWARLRPSPQSGKVDVSSGKVVMTSISDVIVMSHACRWLFKAVPAKMDMAPVNKCLIVVPTDIADFAALQCRAQLLLISAGDVACWWRSDNTDLNRCRNLVELFSSRKNVRAVAFSPCIFLIL